MTLTQEQRTSLQILLKYLQKRNEIEPCNTVLQILKILLDESASAKEAISNLHKLAKAENDNEIQYACCLLGYCYEQGLGVERDPRTAMAYYKTAVEKGSEPLEELVFGGLAIAQYYLARCYERGLGVEKDEKRASELFFIANAQGFPPGETVQIDPKRTTEFYRIAAQQGSAIAQYYLGRCYEQGYGVAKDQNQATELYYRAMAQGCPEAIYYVGRCYEFGHGVEKDMALALHLLYRAALKRYATAQYHLGMLYYSDHGYEPYRGKQVLEKDPLYAACFLQAAAENGNIFAQEKLTSLKKDSHVARLENVFNEYQNFLIIGLCHEFGFGTAQDRKMAVEYYLDAIRNGSSCYGDLLLCIKNMDPKDLGSSLLQAFYKELVEPTFKIEIPERFRAEITWDPTVKDFLALSERFNAQRTECLEYLRTKDAIWLEKISKAERDRSRIGRP